MRLVWASPTTVPTTMVAAAIAHRIGVQSDTSGLNVDRNTRAKAAIAAAFTPVDMKPVTSGVAPS